LLDFPEKDYRFMEYQANTFANALLLPQHELELRFESVLSKIQNEGIDTREHRDVSLESIRFERGRVNLLTMAPVKSIVQEHESRLATRWCTLRASDRVECRQAAMACQVRAPNRIK